MNEFYEDFDVHHFESNPDKFQNLVDFLNESSFTLTDRLYFNSRDYRKNTTREISFSKNPQHGDDEIYLSDLLTVLSKFFARVVLSNKLAILKINFDDTPSFENFISKIESLTIKHLIFNVKHLVFEYQNYYFLPTKDTTFEISEV